MTELAKTTDDEKPKKLYSIQITDDDHGGAVISEWKTHDLRKARKCEDGLQHNLNHERYSTRIINHKGQVV